MKRTLFLLSALCAFVLVGCDGKTDEGIENDTTVSGPIAKYTFTKYIQGDKPGDDPQKHHMEVVTPVFDSQNRVVKYHKDVFIQEAEWLPDQVVKHFIQTVSEDWVFSYDEQKHSGTLTVSGEFYNYNDNFSSHTTEKFSDSPIALSFSDDWCLTSMGDRRYSYSGGRLASGTIMDVPSTVTWTGSNITSVKNEHAEYTIAYSRDPNPFSFLDFGLFEVLPAEYLHGLMGKPCANLPSSVSLSYIAGGEPQVDNCSFTKDKSGRITQICFDRADLKDWYSTIDIEY